MSLDHAFFYKSVNGDRVYDDTSFEHWLKKFFTSGVFLNDLQVTANEDMTVTVGAGYVNADGKVKVFGSTSSLIIETAGASYPRIDSIVLERNDTERDILLKVVKGGYSSEPVPHTPVRQNGVYQLVIAQVLVNAGAVKVTQANITDTRSNTELCGIVAGAVDQIDFSQVQAQFDDYFAQYKAQITADYMQYNEDMETYLDQMAEDFAAWFEGIRNQLDEDAAGHLQNQINDIKAEMELLGGSIVEVTIIDDEGEYNVEGLEVNLVIDGKTYTETIPSEKVVKFTGVLEVGTAVITCVDEAQEFNAETSIDIPYYGAYECSIIGASPYYDLWLESAGYTKETYPTAQDLLADEAAVRILMTKKDSVDILAQMGGDDLATIINHPYAAKWINYREYAYSTLSAISKIKTLMDASGMYGMYITVESDGTWQPKGLVPVMTSDTAPYGEASTYANHQNGRPYIAFQGKYDSTKATAALSDTTTDAENWICYKFVNPVCVRRFSIIDKAGNSSYSVNSVMLKIQGSNDGSEWKDVHTIQNYTATIEEKAIDINNSNHYLYYRLLYSGGAQKTSGGAYFTYVYYLQFYGRQLEALIPPMTSNTTPIGKVSASSYGNQTADSASYAFNGMITNAYSWATEGSNDKQWIQYEFEKPQVVTAICVNNNSMTSTTLFSDYAGILKGSNDGSKWDDLTEITVKKTSTSYIGFVEFENTTAYKYYRLLSTKNNVNYGGYNYVQIDEISLYGVPDYESRTYIYDHGVEVMEFAYTIGSAGVTAEEDGDEIYLVSGSASSDSYSRVDMNVDLTNYSLIRARIGSVISNITNGASIGVSNNGASVASVTFTTSNIPLCSIDVSSVNGDSFIQIAAHSSQSAKVKIDSWWLE